MLLLGVIQAGFPTPAEETNLDQITLDDWLIENRNGSYMLKVKNDSMKDAGILSGDYVIVEKTNEALPGNIVISEIDNHWSIRYLRKDKIGYFLEPANNKYKTIRPEESISISAVVKAVVRKL